MGIRDAVVSGGGKLVEGDKVRCNAWLLDDATKIPYLVSTLWSEGSNVDSQILDKIMGMPDVESMQVYHKLSRDLSWMLPSNKKKQDAGRDIKPKDSRKDDLKHSRGDDSRHKTKNEQEAGRRNRDEKRHSERSRDRDVKPRFFTERSDDRDRSRDDRDRNRGQTRERDRSRDKHIKRERSRDRESRPGS